MCGGMVMWGEQWRNQVHFTGGAARGQALFNVGQQFNDVII